MTTRDFDPVFSAALRSELESIADRAPATAGVHRTRFRHLPLIVTAVTAVVLLVATVGVLRLTHTAGPASHGARVVDPLTVVTDPANLNFVAREVRVLLHARSIGGGSRTFTVPAGVDGAAVYVTCSGTGSFSWGIDEPAARNGSSCERTVGTSFGIDLRPGEHTFDLRVGATVSSAVLVIARPAPTVASGPLIDPLTAVNDLQNPDAIVGDTRPLGHASGTGAGVASTLQVPAGVQRVRVYFVCGTTSASARVAIDGRAVVGCQNSIAHWADLILSARTVPMAVSAPAGVRWSVLVIRSPRGAKASPANTTLPYPGVEGQVLAAARGAGAGATGTYRQPGDSVRVTTTCRGTGWLEIETGTGSTNTRGTGCSLAKPSVIGFGGEGGRGRHRYTVVPHGDISWTMQLTAD